MKLMLKKIGVFVLAVLIAFTSLEGGFRAYAAEKTNDEIESVVDAYMEAREKLLKNGNAKKLEKVAVVGIVEDENEHRDLLEELGIKVKHIDYEMEGIKDNETYVEVGVVEKFEYTKKGEKLDCETVHTLVLMQDSSNNWWVASDSYLEEATEFVSCAYVPADGEIATMALSNVTIPNFVRVAEAEVGYKEKASDNSLDSATANAGNKNYTKYGKWYGLNGKAWCAIFVSWCANQAGISQTVCMKYASCDDGMQFFKDNSRFYDSITYKGSYTPKAGDVFFTGPSQKDATHTGIVISVSGTTMIVVDGNCGDQVSRHTMSIKDSSLLGFASLCAHDTGTVKKYNASHHWNQCSYCGKQVGLKLAHSFNGYGKCTLCPATKISTAALEVSLLME